MVMDVIMPQLGETVSEGKVSVWHAKVGDEVSTKTPLFDVSSDKVEMEVPAPAEGTLLEIRIEAGAIVPVGEVVAIIGKEGEEILGASEAAPAKAGSPEPAAAALVRTAAVRALNRDANGNPLSPAVRRLIAENNLDTSAIAGTGAGGRIKKRDVLAYLAGGEGGAAARSVPSPAPMQITGETEMIPFNKLRKMTAEHMVRSKATSPHVLQAVEADFGRVVRARKHVAPMEGARGILLPTCRLLPARCARRSGISRG